MRVALDPGHGGSDPGAIGQNGSREADINLAVGSKLKQLLEVNGCEVIMSREADVDCAGPGADANRELQARCAAANNGSADYFVSIHCNAAENPSAFGTETWYYGAGYDLAVAVQQKLAGIGLLDRGAKQSGFYVLRHTVMPAVLVEMGFISNAEEEGRLNRDEFQWDVVKAIADGIISQANAR